MKRIISLVLIQNLIIMALVPVVCFANNEQIYDSETEVVNSYDEYSNGYLSEEISDNSTAEEINELNESEVEINSEDVIETDDTPIDEEVYETDFNEETANTNSYEGIDDDAILYASSIMTLSSDWISNDKIKAAAKKYKISTNSNAYDALESINTVYGNKISDSKKNGTLVFLFEGVGNSSSKSTHMNAMCVVIKNKEIKYINLNSTSIPDSPFNPKMNDGSDMPTLKPGIYSFTTTNHHSKYAALHVSNAKVVRFKNSSNYYSSTSSAINIHRRSWNNVKTSGTPNSAGCQIIGKTGTSSTSEYARFIQSVGIVSSTSKGDVKFKTSVSGQYILDRTYAVSYMTNIGYPKGSIEVLCGTTSTKPSAPKNVTANIKSSSSIALKWDKVSGASKYQIKRGVYNSKTGKIDYTTLKTEPTGTSYTDTGLAANKSYWYRVYAVNSAKKVSESSTLYRTHTKPATPKKPSVDINGTNKLTVKWDKVSGADSYTLYGRKHGDSKYVTIKSNIKGTSYQVSQINKKNLEPGNKYYFKVAAVTSCKIGPYGSYKTKAIESGQSDAITKFTEVKRPENGVVNEKPTNVTLSWTAAKSNYKCVYTVCRDGKQISNSYITGTSYTDTGATPGKIHKYQIKLYEIVNGEYVRRAWNPEFYAGSKITKEISVTPQSKTEMKISWDKPANVPSGAKYTIQKYDYAKKDYYKYAETNNTYYVDKNLKAGETYRYYIQVRDKDGNYLTSTFGKEAKLDISPQKVTLNKSAIALTEGETFNLTAEITPSNSFNKSVSWSSSDGNVASVNSNGVVTTKAAGKAVITASTSNNKKTTCEITVNAKECKHEYGDWIVDKEATCEQDGSHHRDCKNCTESETEPIPATGHSYSAELQMVKEPSCSEEGEQAYVCSVCGAQKDNVTVDKTEHTFGEWKQESVANCTKEGVETRACNVCGETETRTTEPTDHTYVLTEETEPTLDAPGKRTYVCSVCQDSYTEDWVNVVSEGIISVGGTAPNVGTTVSIPVTISENPGIAGFTFTVNYDKSVLTPKKITAGDLTTSGIFTSNLDQGIPAEELSQVAVHWDNSTNITGDGVLFNVEFDVSATAAEGEYAIWLTYENGDITNQNLDDVKPVILDNTITIADVIRGDVNLDREVDIRDGILLARYLAKWNINFTDRQFKAANVYGDSTVNAKDAVRLAQILIGYTDAQKETDGEAVTAAAAEGTANITVENTEAVVGDTIYVPISISDNTGIAGFDMQLKYDSQYLTPVSLEKGEILTDGDFSSSIDEESNTAETDTVTVHWNDASDMTENGTLFTIGFEVSEDVTTGQALPIEIICDEGAVCDSALNNVVVSAQNAAVDIVENAIPEFDNDVPKEYYITYVIADPDNQYDEIIPKNGNCEVEIGIESMDDTIGQEHTLFVALYDINGALIDLINESVNDEVRSNGICKLHINETDSEIDSIKVFIWDSTDEMQPLSDTFELTAQNDL